MGYSFTYQDAWQAGQLGWRRSVEPSAFEYATNVAISKMWNAYDWRGSVQNFNPFWLVPGEQDYGAPLWRVPTDFYGIREVYLVNIGSNTVPIRTPMRVVENLQETHVLGLPSNVCYRPAIQGFRIFPGAAFGSGCPLYLVDGTYKIRPPKITRNLQTSLLLFDDVYFETFVQALTWAVLQSSGDRRAASEQLAVFYQTLAESTAWENREDGEPTVAPSEGLVPRYGGAAWGYGGFGFGGF